MRNDSNIFVNLAQTYDKQTLIGRRAIARIFQLNVNKSETAEDIYLKFLGFVHHSFWLNWPKNYSHCSINGSVAPSSMQKLWTPLSTIFVEKQSKKMEFWIFWTSAPSESNGLCLDWKQNAIWRQEFSINDAAAFFHFFDPTSSPYQSIYALKITQITNSVLPPLSEWCHLWISPKYTAYILIFSKILVLSFTSILSLMDIFSILIDG